jgi:thioredoxin-related protein
MKYLISILLTVVFITTKCQTADSTTAIQSDTTYIKKDTLIYSQHNFENFKKKARFENKPYMVFFTASWCAPCHKLKDEVLTNDKIIKLLNDNYLVYYLDMEDFEDLDINEKYFHVQQLPTFLFFDPKGTQIDKGTGYFEGYYLFKKIRAHIPPHKQGKDWYEE